MTWATSRRGACDHRREYSTGSAVEFWKSDKPTADDFIRELAKPFPLELSMNHLGRRSFGFAVSTSEEVVTGELTRTPMTTHRFARLSEQIRIRSFGRLRRFPSRRESCDGR